LARFFLSLAAGLGTALVVAMILVVLDLYLTATAWEPSRSAGGLAAARGASEPGGSPHVGCGRLAAASPGVA